MMFESNVYGRMIIRLFSICKFIFIFGFFQIFHVLSLLFNFA